MKRGIKILNLILLAFLALAFLGHASTTSYSMQIDSVTPYDHGVVVTVSYTDYSSHQTRINVYYYNTTSKELLYNKTFAGCPSAFTFTYDGKLYLVIRVTTYNSYYSSVYVFQGFKLVNHYRTHYMFIVKHNPLFNITSPILEYSSPGCVKYIITLNSTNITLTNQFPVILLKLPEGLLVVTSKVVSIAKIFHMSLLITRFNVYNFTLYNYNGKIIWSRAYRIFLNIPTSCVLNQYGYSALISGFLKSHYITLVGDEIYIMNLTSASINEVNLTIVGINIKTGQIVNRINLDNVPPYQEAILNIGGKLYAVIFNNEAVVEEYNGHYLVRVAEIPVKIVAVSYTPGIMLPPGEKVYPTAIQVAASVIIYNFGKYLLFINSGNVTVVYPGGVMHYTLQGEVPLHVYSDNAIVLSKDGNVEVAFLNNDGGVEKVINIGKANNITTMFALCLCNNGTSTYPQVIIVKHYVVKVYKNEITVYGVSFNSSVEVNSQINVPIKFHSEVTTKLPALGVAVITILVGVLLAIVLVKK